jgi:hypothetical protein
MAKKTFLDFEQPIADLESKIEELRYVQTESAVDISDEIDQLAKKSQQLTKDIYSDLTPWQITKIARHAERPYTLDYITEIFTDFVELHGAHGYLLHQFWRRDVNRREDKWGDPTLFATEVIKAVRAAVGVDIPILYRFSIHSDDPAATDEPVTPESLSVYLKALEDAGVDVWDISCWRESRRGYFGTTTLLPEWVRQASNLPRIVAGNFLEPAGAAEYCQSGFAEGIALARGLISDAAWCERAQVGDAYRPYQDSDLHELHAGRDPGV